MLSCSQAFEKSTTHVLGFSQSETVRDNQRDTRLAWSLNPSCSTALHNHHKSSSLIHTLFSILLFPQSED